MHGYLKSLTLPKSSAVTTTSRLPVLALAQALMSVPSASSCQTPRSDHPKMHDCVAHISSRIAEEDFSWCGRHLPWVPSGWSSKSFQYSSSCAPQSDWSMRELSDQSTWLTFEECPRSSATFRSSFCSAPRPGTAYTSSTLSALATTTHLPSGENLMSETRSYLVCRGSYLSSRSSLSSTSNLPSLGLGFDLALPPVPNPTAMRRPSGE
mmetsp:Transcript_54191/g.107635  ORF Transcript_54191/g.107635 Transcript_54191/m.107635 type:complete len:209 (+) Transcript_54191:187-813(+)